MRVWCIWLANNRLFLNVFAYSYAWGSEYVIALTLMIENVLAFVFPFDIVFVVVKIENVIVFSFH